MKTGENKTRKRGACFQIPKGIAEIGNRRYGPRPRFNRITRLVGKSAAIELPASSPLSRGDEAQLRTGMFLENQATLICQALSACFSDAESSCTAIRDSTATRPLFTGKGMRSWSMPRNWGIGKISCLFRTILLGFVSPASDSGTLCQNSAHFQPAFKGKTQLGTVAQTSAQNADSYRANEVQVSQRPTAVQMRVQAPSESQ